MPASQPASDPLDESEFRAIETMDDIAMEIDQTHLMHGAGVLRRLEDFHEPLEEMGQVEAKRLKQSYCREL